ncbi:MAG: DUF1549 domain-containing protein, partial [Planctomycetota bacterium]
MTISNCFFRYTIIAMSTVFQFVCCRLALVAIVLALWPASHNRIAHAQESPTSQHAEVTKILAQHCFECHGPDVEERQAGLRLDDRTVFEKLESGKFAIVPGHAQQSELIRRIKGSGGEEMPPKEAGRKLTQQEIALIEEWIEGGARWQEHWSFQKPDLQSVPYVQNRDWPRDPIDNFVMAKLEAAGASPVGVADRRVLIRRLYFDLHGVPPTYEQIKAFEFDQDPQAWDKLINKLLDSPAYGQRWGRHWLDVVRYADSNGTDENHLYPLAWRYRNYVIDTLNADLPFDEFVREQLAGDLESLSERKLQAQVATGFLAIGTKILAEKDPVKKQADIVDEQIDTLGKALLGMTIACARCHDHKFDPIPTADYASLGTPWEVDTRGAILMLEDITEPPYRIDRMLEQLRAAG